MQASSCPNTCAQPDAEAQCTDAPQPGCRCKENFVLSGQNCVHKDQCGCEHGEKYFPVSGNKCNVMYCDLYILFFLYIIHYILRPM